MTHSVNSSSKNTGQTPKSIPIFEHLLPTPQSSDASQGAVIGKEDIYYMTKTGFPRKINRNGKDGSVGLPRLLTLLPEDSPASPSVLQDENEARKTTVISGQKCLELLKSSSPLGLLVKTLLESSIWYSNKCVLTWKMKAMKSNRLLFQLYPSTHHTAEIGSGLLPTARAGNPGSRPNKKGGKILAEEIAMLKTPSASEAVGGWKVADKYWDAKAPKLKMRDQVGRKTGLKLQPNFVEWMMGYPKDWTEIPDSKLLEMQLSRKLQKK